MKNLKNISIFLFVAILFSCGNQQSNNTKTEVIISDTIKSVNNDIDYINEKEINSKEDKSESKTDIIEEIIPIDFKMTKEEKLISSFCKDFNYKKIERGFNKLQNKTTNKRKYVWQTDLEREIINDFFEQIIEFRVEIQEEENPAVYSVYTNKISLIKTKDGRIAFYKINRLENVKINEEWREQNVVLQKDSSSLLKKLQADFKKTYDRKLDFDELFETQIVYGSHCGFAGMEPKYRIKMNKLVELKDSTTLIKWLKSATIEIQLYAIDGILNLKKNGLKFDTSTLELIELIENKEGEAYTCSGCTHWNRPINEIIEKIKKSP
ncbi:hypothetical protein Fleli_2358 [Bernardetia litoralis DSM 6794]|uniref:Lipoprotein n=1 Tax=Bernardetia litoralis (strain ATCC 23117 / DSM 6794 / NBRC 15988 / NCIMB 1366 / Fx l1 / Sio-4) TaxID=880071 RepID=I4AL95_BERLS|nr:hypothetical protein [Bernardetia litoralis]AFM04730.1 hypothetical protein Fleli_2358 [Bernardetia litoralis DSM 6794]